MLEQIISKTARNLMFYIFVIHAPNYSLFVVLVVFVCVFVLRLGLLSFIEDSICLIFYLKSYPDSTASN